MDIDHIQTATVAAQIRSISHLARVHVQQVEGIPRELDTAIGLALLEEGVLRPYRLVRIRSQSMPSPRQSNEEHLRTICQMRSADTFGRSAIVNVYV